LAGVPGTVGGAVWGNAGAWGGAVADRVLEVRIVRAAEGVTEIPRARIPFRYRHAGLPAGAVVTRASFGLCPDDAGLIRRRISGLLVQRSRTQPVASRSAGSIFRNPEGDFAGRLVEAAGLKGTRLGGAEISARHANFILNRGGASAADILGLIELARRRVLEHSGVPLELEVQVVGVDAA
ncbi:MAG: UDP-N-acetylenolpyruvoylglucosamine reductase, partial [Candidatus Methylomirabilota bacterium]